MQKYDWLLFIYDEGNYLSKASFYTILVLQKNIRFGLLANIVNLVI